GPDMAMLGASLFATHGILGALYHKWRTGEGQHVEVSMLGSILHQRALAFTATVNPDEWAGFYCEGYVKPPEHGYKTGDQPILLAAIRGQDRLPELLRALGMEQYIEHPLLQHPVRNIMGTAGAVGDAGLKAKPLWEEGFKRWKAEELLRVLDRFSGSSAHINTYRQLFSHAQTAALGMVKEMPGRSGQLKALGPSWKLYGLQSFEPRPYQESALDF
ncbi:MAG: CoA transferase, partial [Chloroflexi bacterium]|nr:CoA transferase [Chloroflexota bacterium]